MVANIGMSEGEKLFLEQGRYAKNFLGDRSEMQ
jgi:hypothetical protein